MSQEQAVLSAEAQLFFEELIAPTPDGEGITAPAVDDLHAGVVTTDLGSGGFTIATCRDPDVGDDGVLQNTSTWGGCAETYSASDCAPGDECPWLAHPGDRPIWEDFGCIAPVGCGGCGFEQPLEASLRALTDKAAPGQVNEGFLREQSLVVVVYVTDEDDGSAADPAFFDPDRDDLGPLNVRVIGAAHLLHPVDRYVDGLRELRPAAPGRVVVGGIVGIPADGSWTLGDPMEELRELQQIGPVSPNEILRSCETGMGVAYPPVRIAELADKLSPSAFLASICLEDWSESLTNLARLIQSHLYGACVDLPAGTEPSACRVVELLPDGSDCPHPADEPGPGRTTGWQVDLGLDADGRRRCEILSADADNDSCPDGDGDNCNCATRQHGGCLPGWFYEADAQPCESGRIALTDNALVDADSSLRFECLGSAD